MRTTDDVECGLCDEGEHIDALASSLLQLGDQHPRLLVEHVHELVQNGEVEGGCQHLPPFVPLDAWDTGNDDRGRYIGQYIVIRNSELPTSRASSNKGRPV